VAQHRQSRIRLRTLHPPSDGHLAPGGVGHHARLARRLLERCADLTDEIRQLDAEIAKLVQDMAPALLNLLGCGTLTAAKIIGETADVRRFRSKDANARSRRFGLSLLDGG
jgi:transposase